MELRISLQQRCYHTHSLSGLTKNDGHDTNPGQAESRQEAERCEHDEAGRDSTDYAEDDGGDIRNQQDGLPAEP